MLVQCCLTLPELGVQTQPLIHKCGLWLFSLCCCVYLCDQLPITCKFMPCEELAWTVGQKCLNCGSHPLLCTTSQNMYFAGILDVCVLSCFSLSDNLLKDDGVKPFAQFDREHRASTLVRWDDFFQGIYGASCLYLSFDVSLEFWVLIWFYGCFLLFLQSQP